jgi:hypothetical protein
MGLRTQNFHIDTRYCEARRFRMKPQRLARSDIVAVRVAHDRRLNCAIIVVGDERVRRPPSDPNWHALKMMNRTPFGGFGVLLREHLGNKGARYPVRAGSL